jgi:hypothetical protein
MATSARPIPYFPDVSRDWRRIAVQIAAGLAALTREMSFVEHLEELRRRLIWSVVFVAAAFGLCWIAAADLLEIAKGPLRAASPEVTLSLFRAQDIVGLASASPLRGYSGALGRRTQARRRPPSTRNPQNKESSASSASSAVI